MELRCAFSNNPRIRPLVDRAVQPRDVQLSFSFDSPPNWFERHLRDSAFDVFEFSLAHYLITRDRPRPQWDWIALPIFLSKALGAMQSVVHVGSGIHALGDLRGKRFGIPDFTMTAGLWMRAMLREVHGIQPGELLWYVGRSRSHSQGVLMGIDEHPLPGICLQWLYEAGAINRMLHAGELDAGYATAEDPIDTTGDDLEPLFPDGGRQLVSDFFRRRGFVPANHLVLMQRRLAEEHTWLPAALFEAFEASKQEAYRRDAGTRLVFPPLSEEDADAQIDLFGDDPYASGISRNVAMVTMAAEQSALESTISRAPAVPDLFHDSLR